MNDAIQKRWINGSMMVTGKGDDVQRMDGSMMATCDNV